MTDNNKNTAKNSDKEINLQWFFVNLLIHWKWFLASLLFFLLAGFFYLRYTAPVYCISASIILKDSKRGGMSNSELSVFEKLGYLDNNSSNVENELEVLRSRNLVESVVRATGLYVTYEIEGRFRNTELFGDRNTGYTSTPVKVFADNYTLDNLNQTISLKVSYVSPALVKVTGNYGTTAFVNKTMALPAVLKTPAGEILLSPGDKGQLREDTPLTITINSPLNVALHYIAALGVALTDKNTTVVRLSVNDTHRQRGEVFLDKLIAAYNKDAMDEKDKASLGAARFVTDRIEKLGEQLQESEKEIEAFKQKNHISNVEVQSQILLTEENEYEKKLVQLETDLLMLTYLEQEAKTTPNVLVTPSLSVSGTVLAPVLEKYNQATLKRDQLAMYLHPEAKEMQDLEGRIRLIKADVIATIDKIRASLNIQKKEIKNLRDEYAEDILNIPRRDRQLEELVRQQMVQSNLYVDLLKRQESINLTLAVTAPTAKILENPLVIAIVSPIRSLIYLMCLLCGIVLPFIIFGLWDLLKRTVSSENEVCGYLNIPVIVSLPQSKLQKPVVVTVHATSAIAERFRLLRTNLQFIMDSKRQKTVLITSTISGEGKTFVAINLAMTFALRYKTLLVGLDIRRPTMGGYLGLPPKKEGIVSFLTGQTKDPEKLIYKKYQNSNLDILLSGVVPPNPNELLIDAGVDELFEKLREHYDYIIIDSSPAGSVSDTFLLNRVADISLLIVRKDRTPKAAISFINEVREDDKLKDVHLVLNAFDGEEGEHYGYGYGYGYGYRSE